MIPIGQFCWQDFVLEEHENITIGALTDMAYNAAHQDQLFVLHDPAHRQSALVMPPVVIDVVDQLGLSYDQVAAEAGLFDVLRARQLIVRGDQTASQTAALAAWHDADVILTVDEFWRPEGLLIVPVMLATLLDRRLILQAPLEFQQRLKRLVGLNDLPGAFSLVEMQYDYFHSESRMVHMRTPYVCSGYGEIHTIGHCPCSRHPGADCRPRTVR